ncbi:hypothetical protein SDC9_50167 [bioreactor metagenome]|uniref:Uncharacterized protein n=1 Tax=bioreactor metagenome TaxID=1076179 RepID=A0A644WJF5_9ZZZZ
MIKSIKTVIIAILLLTTGLTATGAVIDIKTNTIEEISTIEQEQENHYRGYTFSADSPENIKSEMKDIIDQVYVEKAKLYLMEQKEQELQYQMGYSAEIKRFDLNAIYGIELNKLREEIRPQRFLTLELTNFEDTSYAYCLKDLDIAVENIEILKEVEKNISKN